MMQFLNTALLQAELNIRPGPPITSIQRNGRFAFAEFRCGLHIVVEHSNGWVDRTTDEATQGLNLDGICLMGHALQVGRPSGYQGPPTPAIRWEQLMMAKIASNPALADQAVGLPGGTGIQLVLARCIHSVSWGVQGLFLVMHALAIPAPRCAESCTLGTSQREGTTRV